MQFISKEPINRGFSRDKKYCAVTADGEKYLLRTSPKERYNAKKHEFEMMQMAAKTGVPICTPIEFGECDEGVYTVLSWIDGVCAEEFLPTVCEKDAYALGIESGEILKKLHTIPAPDTASDWQKRFIEKSEYKIGMYKNCGVRFEGDDKMISYMRENYHLLEDRPQCFQHDDYHPGNMMIKNQKLVIIDFERCDFGDPWEEFDSITWSVDSSPYFAAGMVDGYFEGNVPNRFWQLLALYICRGVIASVPWSIPYGEKEVNKILTIAKNVFFNWYDEMKETVPKWYKKV